MSETPTEILSPWRRPEFVRLLGISITVALGFGLVVPVLPRFAQSFGVGLAAIGLVQLVFGSTRFSFGLVGGLVVDRFGERACTIAGLLIVSLSSYAAGFSDTFTEFVLARGFGGAGSALFIAGLQSRILRIIEPEAMGRATGAFRSSFLVGIGLGPLLGGFLGESFGLAAPFHIYATGLLVSATVAWFVMAGQPPRGPSERKRPMEAFRAARPLFSDRRYVLALLATFVGWWTLAGPVQTVGVIFAEDELGFSGAQIGAAVTMLSVGELLVLMVAGRASDRFGRRSVMVPSLLVAAVATALFGQIYDFSWAYFPLMVLVGGAIAASGTAAGGLLADSIPKGGSGAAVGVNQMAGDLGYLISPTLIGSIAERASFGLAYIVAAVPAAVVLGAAMTLPKPVPAEEVDDGDVHQPIEPVG